MNALDVLAVVRELSAALVGGRFDKAFQPTREELILRFRRPKRAGEAADVEPEGGEASPAEGPEPEAAAPASTKAELAIGVGKYLTLTEFPREMPVEPSQLAMTLRKHLSGARVVGVRQVGIDRVVEIELTRKEGTFLLVSEFFHDGNVILVKDGRIVTALAQQSWATREVRPGAEFRLPPARDDPRLMDVESFRRKMRASDADVVRTLATELGLGGGWAEEITARAGLDKGKPVREASDDELDRAYDAMQRAFRDVEDGALDPVIARKGEAKEDVSPIPLASHAKLALERHPTFMQAADRYFSKPVTVERVDPRVKKLDEEKTKIRRMYDAQKAAIEKFEAEAVEARHKGDTLYAHFATVQRLSERLLAAAKEFGWKEVQQQLKGARAAGQAYAQLVESMNPHDGTGTFLLDDLEARKVRVTVDLRKSVQDNANDYYERSKKMREKLEGARHAFAQTEAKLREAETRGVKLVAEVEKERSKAKPTKRLWFETYRWFFTSDGHLVMGGRDATSNEKLVKKHLEDNDRYVHADVSGAPSCVVKSKEGAVSDAALDEAAQFAVSMSRAWSAGVGAGEAYWVTPAQVSKTPNPGEYVTKGAFIIRGKRNYLRKPLQLAVGEVEVEGARKVMGGPPGAVASRAKRYVLLAPGPERTNAVANRLAKAFGVPVEEVQAVMPPGDVTVVEERL